MVVAAANLKARASGVRTTMRLSEAQVLGDVEVIEHEPGEDIERLCWLSEQAQQFSPLVGLEPLGRKSWAGRTLHQPECLLLDITGIGRIYGNEAELAKQLGNWLGQLDYFGCIGIAGTIGSAWAIANYALRRAPNAPQNLNQDSTPAPSLDTNQSETSSQPSSTNEPANVPESRFQIVEPECERPALAGLPIVALRQPKNTVESLRRLGIRRIGDLQSLPREGMASRLGEDLLLRWDQAVGLKDEPFVTLHSQPDWCLEQTLEYPTTDRDTIGELVIRNCQELSKRLSKRGEGAIRLICRLDLLEAPPLLMQLSLFRPSNDANHLEGLLLGQLENTIRVMGENQLWRLSLQATMTAPLVYRQAGLFNANESDQRSQIANLVDTLSNRLGRKRVLAAKTKRESQPELAYTLSPLTGVRKDGTPMDTVKKISTRLASGNAAPSRDDPLRRPSHLHERPLPIKTGFNTANESAPVARESNANGLESSSANESQPATQTQYARAPDLIELKGKRFQVTEAVGPERLESGWWRGPSSRRDYYRIEVHSGDWYWIFRDLQTGNWFLHGQFD